MNSERQPVNVAREGFFATLALFPAFYIGGHLGTHAADIGSAGDLGSILLRSLVCTLPAALLALLFSRLWLLPALIYGYGFHIGYMVRVTFAKPFVLTVGRPGTLNEPSHPELFWIYVLALWVSAFVSFLRLHYAHRKENAS